MQAALPAAMTVYLCGSTVICLLPCMHLSHCCCTICPAGSLQHVKVNAALASYAKLVQVGALPDSLRSVLSTAFFFLKVYCCLLLSPADDVNESSLTDALLRRG